MKNNLQEMSFSELKSMYDCTVILLEKYKNTINIDTSSGERYKKISLIKDIILKEIEEKIEVTNNVNI